MAKIADRLGKWEARHAALERQKAEEDFNGIVEWKGNLRIIWQAAEKLGREPADPWPHPDDIILNEEKLLARVRGPRRESDLPRFEYRRAMRDAHLISSVFGFAWNEEQQAGLG